MVLLRSILCLSALVFLVSGGVGCSSNPRNEIPEKMLEIPKEGPMPVGGRGKGQPVVPGPTNNQSQ